MSKDMKNPHGLFKDLTGQTFGRLKVVSYGGRLGVRGRHAWLCICECGKQTTVRAVALLRGQTKSCGCLRIESAGKHADLVGQKFERLTVLQGVYTLQRDIIWLCQCDCGIQTLATTNSLTSGKGKSCGCYAREINLIQLKDITGQKFGRLTVLRLAERKGHSILWLCRCDCGKEKVTPGGSLRNGFTKSCGCLNSEIVKARNALCRTHGQTGSSEYATWSAMKGRCLDPRHRAWKDYGKRGITVCERWLKFENFYEDMGPRPSPKHSLDRIDNDGNYEPGNCRWALQIVQVNNRRGSRYIEFKGESRTIAQWANHLGFPHGVLNRRLAAGWGTEKALTTPKAG